MSAKREYIVAVQAVCNPVVFSHLLTLRVSVVSEM